MKILLRLLSFEFELDCIMMNFWDEKFAGDDYYYGTEANDFFKMQIDLLKPGKLLLPAEGEGRNAIYAAKKGWEVVAFDQSEVAKHKALKLAELNDVKIEYQHCDVQNFEYQTEDFDTIGLVFLHLPEELRIQFHNKIYDMLKPKGVLICEFFSKEQFENSSGGPKNLDMLYSVEGLKQDFSKFKNISITKHQVLLDEGEHHVGSADVIRIVGIK